MQQAAPGSENAVLKPERETAVRALLKGRDALAVLPTGYGPRKKRFCHCLGRFQKSIAPVLCVNFNIPLSLMGMKTRLLRTINQKEKP